MTDLDFDHLADMYERGDDTIRRMIVSGLSQDQRTELAVRLEEQAGGDGDEQPEPEPEPDPEPDVDDYSSPLLGEYLSKPSDESRIKFLQRLSREDREDFYLEIKNASQQEPVHETSGTAHPTPKQVRFDGGKGDRLWSDPETVTLDEYLSWPGPSRLRFHREQPHIIDRFKKETS